MIVLVCALLAGCGSASTGHRGAALRVPSDGPARTVAPLRPAVAHRVVALPSARRVQLPRGGRAIIGHYRVVAYYGAAGGGALGVLGRGSPEHAARSIARRAAGFRAFGLPVQPAMELIATVAQSSPGPDGDYSTPVSRAVMKRYLAAAHRHKMLLILDLQPGRASFLAQVRALHHLLRDPSVGIGLDPEWKVTSGAPGGGRIGSSAARPINQVIHYVQRVVRANRLPDKLLVVHEFTSTMLPDRRAITPRPGVEVSFHADGFGSPAVKKGVFRQLRFPRHPFGIGFKLFLTQDSRLMTPREVMRLRPRPDIVTYQ